MSMPSSLALALALSDSALIQPWSAAGALNATLTSPPWAAVSPVVLVFVFAVAVAAGLSELLSPPQATTPSPSATPAQSTGATLLNFIGALLLIELPFQITYY